MHPEYLGHAQRQPVDTTTASCPIPGWAAAVLADPRTNEPIQLPTVSSFDDISANQEFAVVGRIAYLIALTPQELQALDPQYGWMIELIDHRREVLRPAQVRIRRLLRRFAQSLSRGAVVADLACNDGEFSPFFDHCRYLAMDLWPRALEVALDSGRIKFGIIADVRRPPFLPASLDAFVSTGTLNHLPAEQIVEAAVNLGRFVKPGGQVAITVPDIHAGEIIKRLSPDYKLRERELFYGPVDRSWSKLVTRNSRAVIQRVRGRRLAEGLARAQNAAAGAAYGIDRMLNRLGVGTFTWDWLVFTRARAAETSQVNCSAVADHL